MSLLLNSSNLSGDRGLVNRSAACPCAETCVMLGLRLMNWEVGPEKVNGPKVLKVYRRNEGRAEKGGRIT